MNEQKQYQNINGPKERLRIVLESLQPGVNKSELCQKEGIYIQQLVRWTQEALKGAEEKLDIITLARYNGLGFEKTLKLFGVKPYRVWRWIRNDDFVVCFQSKTEAKVFSEALKARLAEFGLKIAEGKSRVIEFGRYVWEKTQRFGRKPQTFDFLGFTHYCDKTRSGKFKLGRKTTRAKFIQKMKAMNMWLKGVRNAVKLRQWWTVLSMKLAGHYRYYGVSGNSYCIRTFYSQTVKLAYKWINRRSQKRSYNWVQFNRIMQFNPLPEPKIYHQLYTLSSNMGRITEEPNVGNPQVRFCEGY